MRIIALLISLIIACSPWIQVRAQPGVIGPPNAISCNKLYGLSPGSAGLQTMVAGVTGQSIFICGWQTTISTGNATWQLFGGTGTNCGTVATALTPPMNIGTTPLTTQFGYAVLQLSQGANLCVNTASSNMAVIVWGAQF